MYLNKENTRCIGAGIAQSAYMYIGLYVCNLYEQNGSLGAFARENMSLSAHNHSL
jgi:hypothetical protein